MGAHRALRKDAMTLFDATVRRFHRVIYEGRKYENHSTLTLAKITRTKVKLDLNDT